VEFATQMGTHKKTSLNILLKEIEHWENLDINRRTVGY
jgi:hypothetical protein